MHVLHPLDSQQFTPCKNVVWDMIVAMKVFAGLRDDCEQRSCVTADLPLGVVTLGVLIADTVVGLEAAHGKFCVSSPVHRALIDVG